MNVHIRHYFGDLQYFVILAMFATMIILISCFFCMPIGFHPTPDFKPKIPLDNLMMTKVVDNTSQKGRRTEAALNMFLLD